jgi:hypothetical protein
VSNVKQPDIDGYKNDNALPADELRTPTTVMLPDVRSSHFQGSDIQIMHKRVSEFSLADVVPKEIHTQYDTARNLYLHAYYVYRFYNVAQQHLYGVLELAIRTAVGEVELGRYQKQQKKQGKRFGRGLSLCLHYLTEHNLIVDEDFPRWHHNQLTAKEHAYRIHIVSKMKEQNLSEYAWDEDECNAMDVEHSWSLVDTLCECLPKIRNNFAHGSTSLYNSVMGDFEDVSVIINQVYERTQSSKPKSNNT